MSTYRARHIPENAIVRLPDGRIGYMSHNTPARKPWVIVKDNTIPGGKRGVELANRDVVLELLIYPWELAFRWLLENT